VALTRDDIVSAALAVLARTGLEDLTLRAVAAELGVSAPTLYWHVDDKTHLLDLMVEAIYERAAVRPGPAHGEPWWRWLADNARAQRHVLISTRDAAVMVAGHRPTERTIPHLEHMLEALVAVGFDPATALRVLRSLSDFVIGSAVEYQTTMARSLDSALDAGRAVLLRHHPSYPLLRAALGDTEQTLESVFEAGLRWFLTGLRSELVHRETPVLDSVAPRPAP
jgi:TetR/AcrR family transcriptional regulator, tetracycline repressor protein